MKKFLLVPLVLAAGFAILAFVGDGSDKSPDDADMITTPSGLKYKDLTVGDGEQAKPHDTVVVHYTGWLKNGTKFDSSKDHGDKPATLSLDRVVEGWKEGIPGMKVGGKRKLIVPPKLGYGSQEQAKIPPNSELTFEVELVDVKPAGQ
jgi:FKBP-type peptidyl-prolyl cis-trans isomerase